MATKTPYVVLRWVLANDAAVSALVGDRIRPFGKLKQNEELPAVTLYTVSARRWPGFGVSSGHVDSIVQVDCWAVTEAESLDLAEKVRLALKDFSGAVGSHTVRGTFLNTERHWYEEQSETFRVLQQWNVHHPE